MGFFDADGVIDGGRVCRSGVPPSDAACAPGEFGVRWKSAACGFTKFAFTKTDLSMSEYPSF